MGVRRNQSSLSDAERRRFVLAVRRMKTDAGAPYNYDKYPQLHAQVAASTDPDLNPAHRGPAFLPWHRYLLIKFELDIQAADRAAGGDGTITVPYWDWTQDSSTSSPNQQPGSVWHDAFMGGAGSPPSGSFNDWRLAPPNSARSLVRDLGTPAQPLAASPPRTAEVNRALATHGFDCPPFSTRSPLTVGLAAPPAPTVTGTGGGSLAPGVYRVAVTYVNAPTRGNAGETRPSPPRVVCLGGGCAPANANNAITVTPPPATAGALGFRVYVSTAGGAAETMTGQGGLRAPGVPATIRTLGAGPPLPTVNTTASFRNLLEGWASLPQRIDAHNRGHVWIGGSMAPATSPNDPVFFLHHCNVDRLWALWQLRHPGQNYPLVVPKVAGGGNRPEGLRDAMPPWLAPPELVRPIDVLNHTSITIDGRALGYTYDTDPPGVVVNVDP